MEIARYLYKMNEDKVLYQNSIMPVKTFTHVQELDNAKNKNWPAHYDQ